jgi:chemotaxis protein methyltransferase CheR
MTLRIELPETEKYYQLLGSDTPESHLEWKELTVLLTTGESYFFRDQGQFALLQEPILPELLQCRKPQRSLRI